jgi:phage FluMu gp28-like protein
MPFTPAVSLSEGETAGVRGPSSPKSTPNAQINPNEPVDKKEPFPPTDGPGMGWSQCGYRLSRLPRTLAYSLGVPIYDANTREEIDPETARAAALDKRAYDQNYECAFADESLTLLSHELITAAERDGVGVIGEQDWPASALALLRQARGTLYAGFDVARCADLSVICVIEKWDEKFFVRAMLRMRDLSLPEQQKRLGEICHLPKFQRAAIDMTGLGLGLVEFAQKEFGLRKICGINFASMVPVSRTLRADGGKRETVRVTEAMAMELLRAYEHRRIMHPADLQLHDDLRKPERITTPGGRVSIAATRDDAGHADHFWSLALALKAAADFTPAQSQRVELKPRRLM